MRGCRGSLWCKATFQQPSHLQQCHSCRPAASDRREPKAESGARARACGAERHCAAGGGAFEFMRLVISTTTRCTASQMHLSSCSRSAVLGRGTQTSGGARPGGAHIAGAAARPSASSSRMARICIRVGGHQFAANVHKAPKARCKAQDTRVAQARLAATSQPIQSHSWKPSRHPGKAGSERGRRRRERCGLGAPWRLPSTSYLQLWGRASLQRGLITKMGGADEACRRDARAD